MIAIILPKMTEKKKLYSNCIIKNTSTKVTSFFTFMYPKIEKIFLRTSQQLEELVSENIIQQKGYAVSTGSSRTLTYKLQQNRMFLVTVAMA